MDKREEKTIKAIYDGFAKLIKSKDYDEITIQDILNESNVSRSTFYAHYKTKNDLLLSISNNIFEHVFSHSLQEEKTHDYSKDTYYDYHHLIEHIFYHIRDEKELIKGILSSKGNEIFLNEFRNHILKLVNSYYNNFLYRDQRVPLDLKKATSVDNFITVLNYWIKKDFEESPEEVSSYYINLTFY